MTTNYPPGTTPTGPNNVPPENDAAWGCIWWWWIVVLIIILIFWFGGWGWGPYGGWWFRSRPVNQPGTAAPANRGTTIAPATNKTSDAATPRSLRISPSPLALAVPGVDSLPERELVLWL